MSLQRLAKHPLVLLALAFGLGCATHAVTSTLPVAAQSDPAQNVYRECFATKLWKTSGSALNAGEIPDLVRIPAGWHVVGGAGAGPYAVLCR